MSHPTLADQPDEQFWYQIAVSVTDSYATLQALLNTAFGATQDYSKVGRVTLSVSTKNALIAVGTGAAGHPLPVGSSYNTRDRSEFFNLYLANETAGQTATVNVTLWHTRRM